ncbi:MAG: retroviral-like aspartic protease family protein [Candidatus Omnitrophica bacterium]|nr:retroviral-like aspartic protease family protein [Candidatus Omnitrophota bacterium]
MGSISAKSMRFKLILGTFIFLFVIKDSWADTVYLKNGRSIEGFIKSEDEDSVSLDIGLGIVGFRKSDIDKIYRSNQIESALLRQKWEKQRIGRIRKQEEESRIEAAKAKAESLKPKEVKVSRQSGHIFVQTRINDEVSAEMLLDTGASFVLLSNEIGRRLGVDKDKKKSIVKMQVADGRQVNAQYVLLESLKVQGVEAKKVDAAVLLDDVSGINFKDGLLGMSFLKNFNFKIDQVNNRLILERLE